MADILKITTPVQAKGSIPPSKQVDQSNSPFDIAGIERPIVSVRGQNNGQFSGLGGSPLNQQETSSILLDMLTNPSVTVNFLKNITLLQEVIKLLPINNSSTIEELQQMFANLHLSPDKIMAEMALQKDLATIFKGPLFEMLRNNLQQNNSADMYLSVTNLLKALNSAVGKREVLDSVANNLSFLAERFSSARMLHTELKSLEMLFRAPKEEVDFEMLKGQLTGLMEQMRSSILLSDKADRVMSILVYNLSRYNSSEDNLSESVRVLLGQMNDPAAKRELPELVRNFVQNAQKFGLVPQKTSRILDLLATIIDKQAGAQGAEKLVNSSSVEKIVHSLLSSPSNFTPLLHLVIPVEYMGIKSYGEIWIDQNSEYDRENDEQRDNLQLLMAFDIETVGKFELEIALSGRDVRCMLFCPPQYTQLFKQSDGKIRDIVRSVGYSVESLEINKMERQRSLMEVFKALPHKRTGIDVRI